MQEPIMYACTILAIFYLLYSFSNIGYIARNGDIVWQPLRNFFLPGNVLYCAQVD